MGMRWDEFLLILEPPVQLVKAKKKKKVKLSLCVQLIKHCAMKTYQSAEV
jgi:hypothetical protein